jgi:flagellar hook-associated protein 1
MLGRTVRALDAQRYGLDVAGQNIANVNTPGYVRRSAVLVETPPPDPFTPGGGVDVQAVLSSRAPLVEGRLRYEQPLASREGAVADQLTVLESGLGEAGSSLDATLAAFYNTYATLGQAPLSSTARQQVIVQGESLARGFQDMAARFESQRRSADAEIRANVGQLNALAAQLGDVNRQIASTDPSNAQGLFDQQSQVIKAMSELVDLNVISRTDGVVDVSIGNGRALVIGSNVYDVTVSSNGAGYADLYTDGAAVTTNISTEITGGRLGGLLHVRDTLIPSYTNRLDQLAYSIATDVNALCVGGYDLNGNAGVAFFTPPAAVAGAAQALHVNPAVAADNSRVVTSSTTAAGNNDVALAIGRLQDQPMTGGTAKPVEGWSALVYTVATDSATAQHSRDAHEQVAHQLKNLWDQISGVSIDEEAAMLMRFQTAYQANAKFFQIVDDTLALLMELAN